MESPRTKHRLKVPVFTISRNLSQAQPHLHRGINAFSQSLPGKKIGFGRGQTILLILKTEGTGRKLLCPFLAGESGFEPGHVRSEASRSGDLYAECLTTDGRKAVPSC